MRGASGIVLAGGESRRMGSDKRLLDIEGEPMLRRVVARVSSVADDVVVVGGRSTPLPTRLLEDLEVRTATDRRPASGPLAGLEAGLEVARHPLAIVVAGDMPWLEPALLGRLVDRLAVSTADVVAVAREDVPEPLLAAYRREPALAAATRLLDRGERRARALLRELRVETIADPGRSAVNLNTPADLTATRA